MKIILSAVCLFLSMTLMTIHDSSANNTTTADAEIFKSLQQLVGKWKSNTEGKNEFVEYRMTARDSVLVELWTWPDRDIEALTLYHMDDDKLMATHYCPIGNQPRLLFDNQIDELKTIFKFDSATNLSDRSQSHCIEFWVKLNDDGTLSRSETYTEKDGLDTTESTYQRVKTKKQERP